MCGGGGALTWRDCAGFRPRCGCTALVEGLQVDVKEGGRKEGCEACCLLLRAIPGRHPRRDLGWPDQVREPGPSGASGEAAAEMHWWLSQQSAELLSQGFSVCLEFCDMEHLSLGDSSFYYSNRNILL